jgi:hypothetical protein
MGAEEGKEERPPHFNNLENQWPTPIEGKRYKHSHQSKKIESSYMPKKYQNQKVKVSLHSEMFYKPFFHKLISVSLFFLNRASMENCTYDTTDIWNWLRASPVQKAFSPVDICWK